MRRLVFVIAAAMVPAALLALFLFGYDHYDRERSRLTRDSLATTRALVAAVDTELTGARSALFALGTSPHLATGNFGAFHAQAAEALKDRSLASVVLLDEAGRQLVNTSRPFGAPLPAQGSPAALQRVFTTGEFVITDLFLGPVVQRHAIAVGVPVRRGGKIIYSLSGGVAPERVSGLLSQQKLPPGWVAVVLDSTGTIVARTHDAQRLVGQKGSPELLRRSQGPMREDAFDARTVDGIPVLTVFSRSPMSGWTVAIGMPIRDLVLELVYSMARLFVVGFIALVTALGLALLIGRRLRGPRKDDPRVRLAFVIAAAIVPAALLAIVLVGYDDYQRERARLIRDSLGTARALAAAVDAELAGTRSALAALATSPHLAADDLAKFHGQALAALRDQPFINVILLDERGRQLVNTRQRFAEPLPAQADPSELQRIFRTGEAAAGNLSIDPVTRQRLFAVGVPVRREGRVAYVLAAGVAPERLTRILAEQQLRLDRIGAIFDGAGTIVARTHNPEGTIGAKAPPRFLQRMRETTEEVFEGPTLEGTRVLAVFRRSPVSDWTVAIGIPIRDLMAELVYSMARLFVVGFIALATALGIAVLIARKLLPRQA